MKRKPKQWYLMAAMAAMILITTSLSEAARPPALGPGDVPFMYDPNLCTAEVLDFVITRPGVLTTWDFSAYLTVDSLLGVTIRDPAGGGLVYAISRPAGESYFDPNADPVTGQFRKGYRFEWTPPAAGLYYLEVEARILDPNGTNPRITAESVDRRTLLVNVVDPPLKPTIMLGGTIKPTLWWAWLNNGDVDYKYRLRGAQELKKISSRERAGRPLKIGELWGRL